eukprot:TRINITY_DN13130_c0_g1_i1.p1 TRINITY_DN13130_c0_g1~~TRINITY_DN13130_c0_g1_i1.p1  ORF type:complete len:349 (-),score=55.52 TRINITY_DN13130_c0_g1_i1:773-1819(-)
MNDVPKPTCITCRLVFDAFDDQRNHYRTAWHAFNLKRKVSKLPPVSSEIFDAKVAEFKQKQAVKNDQLSKKTHKYRKGKNRRKFVPNHTPIDESGSINPVLPEEEIEPEKTEEELIAERLASAQPIPLTESLFDSHESKDMESNLEYMRVKYGFFIPYIDALHDLEGLLSYLGEKVGIGYSCIYCPREFYTASAAQSHMRDKSHCKFIFFEKEEEYAEFYDLSQCGFNQVEVDDEEEGDENSKQIVLMREEPATLLSEIGELVLKSGATIGHRSLQVYYKQHIRPRQQQSKSLVVQLKEHYAKVGIKEREKNFNRYERSARRRAQNYRVGTGIKANKLQTFFKQQDDY